MKESNIIVIGDVMIDHYIYGKCERISPEAPVPIVNQTKESYTLGGAGNVIENLGAFGIPAFLLSICGDDNSAHRLDTLLQAKAADSYFLARDKERPTTVKTRILAGNHQMLRIDRECVQAPSPALSELLLNELKKRLDKAHIVILSDYCKGLFSTELAHDVVKLCKAQGAITLLDSKQKHIERFKGVDIVKPNKKEAAAMSGIEITDNSSLEAACKTIAEKTDCRAVVVTLSEEGMAIYQDQRLEIIPTKAMEVFDVTGAGDTVIAAIAYALSANKTLQEACDFANHAAAVVVAKTGSATATLTEIDNMKKRWL
ncbi:D-glycero-beta-D-manno-heptose-7-phosphate kinase [Olivibacter sitiensis]|uniref:D-glycero-beta-D-manno-heptose-7-phosphate kinase n=1 Tax=Olivibacter sitiensis TaxID=376470 RepID=UPI00146FA3E5|nr:D-glycero-beta-D-manno-heptose-7-phosphate kinase [Olivibacter sitiensis]